MNPHEVTKGSKIDKEDSKDKKSIINSSKDKLNKKLKDIFSSKDSYPFF